MGAPYISMWNQEQLEIERAALTPGKALDHTASAQYRKRGVAIGDRIYVVATEHGTDRLLLLGRISVGRIVGQREANRVFGRSVYKAPDHVLGPGTELRLDRVVPERIARQIQRESGRPLKIAPDTYRLDRQTLRTAGRLTEESAILLDHVLGAPSLLPFEPQADQEGSRAMRLHVAIERSSRVRTAALVIHGTRCQVCGFSFAEFYGGVGQGFAEVHHLRPLKDLKEAMLVDPAADVAVVCANCHRMVHPEPVKSVRRFGVVFSERPPLSRLVDPGGGW